MLIRKLPKRPKRTERFRSPRHRAFVRGHACVICDAEAPIECAHYSLGSNSGMAQKADDWRCIPLCKDCHQRQHTQGERTFWQGKDPLAIIEALIRTSPVRREIEAHRDIKDGI